MYLLYYFIFQEELKVVQCPWAGVSVKCSMGVFPLAALIDAEVRSALKSVLCPSCGFGVTVNPQHPPGTGMAAWPADRNTLALSAA